MVSVVVAYCCVLPFNNVASAVLQAREYFMFGSKWQDYGPPGNRTFTYAPAFRTRASVFQTRAPLSCGLCGGVGRGVGARPPSVLSVAGEGSTGGVCARA